MANQQTRWLVDAFVEPSDKVTIRAFIRNEIAYYNAVLASMGSRLRTMPEIFDEISDNLMIEATIRGSDVLGDAITERKKIFLDAINGPSSKGVHPATRAAMAVEMLRAHRKQAHSLTQTKGEQLAGPVALLSPHDGRVKRHIQLPAPAVNVVSNDSIRIPYARNPILIRGKMPEAPWNVMVLRDLDVPGGTPGAWSMEFRVETSDYLLRLTDPPLKARRRNTERTR